MALPLGHSECGSSYCYTRTSMENDHENAFGGHGSTFAGAIFMSNRMVKNEFFQRKLFGLPSNKTGFVKRVKMGMILFLFEYEERKLYGVFEATSDGALNIVPNAFLKSGMAFPAQVHFKTIWLCDPLYEDEFGDAIKENYYTHKKFNFGLTYEQVVRLIQLFSLKKKTDSQEHQKFWAHNKLMKKPGKSVWGKTRITDNVRFVKSDRCESKTDNDIDSSGHTLSTHNISRSLSCKKPVLISEDYVVGTQRRLYLTVPCDPESGHPNSIFSTSDNNRISDTEASNSMRLTSSNGHALRGTYHVRSSVDHGYPHPATGSVGRQSPPLGMYYRSLDRELSFCVNRSYMDDQVPPFRTQLNSSQPNLKAMALPVNDYLSLEATSNQETYEGRNTPVVKPSNARLSSIDPEGYSDPRAHNNLSALECYDPSNAQIYVPTPGIFATRGSDSLPYLSSPSNALGCSEAAGQDDGSRGYQYWHRPSSDCIPLSEDGNLLKNRELCRFASSSEDPPDMQYSFPSRFQEEHSSKGPRAFHSTGSYGYHPIDQNSLLHAYSNHEKTGVFSRLSRPPQVRVLRESYGEDANMSPDELVHLLSQKKTQWSKMRQVPRQAIIQDGDEKLEDRAGSEFTKSASLGDTEQNSEIMIEESVELPFRNFKRRSKIRKIDGETERSDHVEDGGGMIKRRKLVRPSLIEEEAAGKENGECRNEGSHRKNVETSTISINCEGTGKKTTDILLVTTCEHSGNEYPIRTATDNVHVHTTERSAEDLRACRSNIQSTSILEDTTLVHAEHTGRVEKLLEPFNNLNSERVAIIDKENLAYISGSAGIQIMNLASNRSNKYDAILENFSPDTECAAVSAQNRKSEEVKVEEKRDTVADAKSSLPQNDKCECEISSEGGAENVIIPDENSGGTLLKSDINNAPQNLEISGKVKHTSHAIRKNNSLLLVDVTCGDKIFDKVVERYMVKSHVDNSNFLSGNNKPDEEQAQSMIHVADIKSVLPMHSKFEGQDPVVADIENRPFSFHEGTCEIESDDYLSLEVGLH